MSRVYVPLIGISQSGKSTYITTLYALLYYRGRESFAVPFEDPIAYEMPEVTSLTVDYGRFSSTIEENYILAADIALLKLLGFVPPSEGMLVKYSDIIASRKYPEVYSIIDTIQEEESDESISNEDALKIVREILSSNLLPTVKVGKKELLFFDVHGALYYFLSAITRDESIRENIAREAKRVIGRALTYRLLRYRAYVDPESFVAMISKMLGKEIETEKIADLEYVFREDSELKREIMRIIKAHPGVDISASALVIAITLFSELSGKEIIPGVFLSKEVGAAEQSRLVEAPHRNLEALNRLFHIINSDYKIVFLVPAYLLYASDRARVPILYPNRKYRERLLEILNSTNDFYYYRRLHQKRRARSSGIPLVYLKGKNGEIHPGFERLYYGEAGYVSGIFRNEKKAEALVGYDTFFPSIKVGRENIQDLKLDGMSISEALESVEYLGELLDVESLEGKARKLVEAVERNSATENAKIEALRRIRILNDAILKGRVRYVRRAKIEEKPLAAFNIITVARVFGYLAEG